MDTLSHGLWGALAFGRANRRSFWLSFIFGVVPDLLSFGIFTAGTWFGIFEHPDWSSGQHPDPSVIPMFVHTMYNITHSLVIFAVAFGIVWAIRKQPFWEMLAWPLHILVDIPTHSTRFFPTPFLWPLGEVHINGIPWSNPVIFIPNVVLLLALYLWFFYYRTKRAKRFQRNRSFPSE